MSLLSPSGRSSRKFRSSDVRTSEDKIVDQHCSFSPVIPNNPYASVKALFTDNPLAKMNFREALENLENSDFMSENFNIDSGDESNIDLIAMHNAIGGLYTSEVGFSDDLNIPAGTSLYYFDPQRLPPFSLGSYPTIELVAIPPKQEEYVMQTVTEMVEESTVEEIEVEEIIVDSIPLAPPMPGTKQRRASSVIVITKKEKAEPEKESGNGQMDLMAEMKAKLMKRAGGDSGLKKVEQKDKPEQRRGSVKSPRKKGAKFVDVMDELAHTLAKLRGEAVEEIDADEEVSDITQSSLSNAAPTPNNTAIPSVAASVFPAASPVPEVAPEPVPVSLVPLAPVTVPVPVSATPFVSKPAVENMDYDIPYCPPLPLLWPPPETGWEPKISVGDVRTEKKKKNVESKKLVPQTVTKLIPPPVRYEEVPVMKPLPSGFYIPKRIDGGANKFDLFEYAGVATNSQIKTLMSEFESNMMAYYNQIIFEKEFARLDDIVEENPDFGPSSTQTGKSKGGEPASKLTVADLPLPPGYYSAVMKMRSAREHRRVNEQLAVACEWRTYDDAEKLAAMKLHLTRGQSPISHVENRKQQKVLEGSSYRKPVEPSDVHILPLCHHIPERNGYNEVAPARDLPTAFWTANLRNYDEGGDVSQSPMVRLQKPFQNENPTPFSVGGSGSHGIPSSPISSGYNGFTPGGVPRCYPPTPRQAPVEPVFESNYRLDRHKLLKLEREKQEEEFKRQEMVRVQAYRDKLKKKATETASSIGIHVDTGIERRKRAIGKLMRQYVHQSDLALSMKTLKDAVLAERDYFSHHPYSVVSENPNQVKPSFNSPNSIPRSSSKRLDTLNNIESSDPVIDSYAINTYGGGSVTPSKDGDKLADLAQSLMRNAGKSGRGSVIISPNKDQAAAAYIPLKERKELMKQCRRASFH